MVRGFIGASRPGCSYSSMVAFRGLGASYSATALVAMDVYRALWRRRFLILILTVATLATTYVVVSHQTKMYKSATLVRVQGRVSDPSQVGSALGVAQQMAQTYAQIVVTDAIAQKVFKVLDKRVPRDHIKLSADPIQGLDLLYITAESPDPVQAADVANAAPVALREFIAAQPAAFRDSLEVVNPAGPSASPATPRVKSALLIALVAGLVFNGALALLVEFLSDRLPQLDGLEAATGKPVLATVPMLEFRSVAADRVQRHLEYESSRPGFVRRLPAETGRESGG
jgi:capsular polysaccharide biosynthesis protein